MRGGGGGVLFSDWGGSVGSSLELFFLFCSSDGVDGVVEFFWAACVEGCNQI
jgi:hypothetical protein